MTVVTVVALRYQSDRSDQIIRVIELDGTFEEYVHRVRQATREKSWRAALGHLKPSAKFDAHGAVPFAGVTVLTPPGDADVGARDTYGYLPRLVEATMPHLSGRHHRISPASYHVTVADLLSGTSYTHQMARHPELHRSLGTVLKDAWTEHMGGAVRFEWRPAGIAFFEHALVCLLAPSRSADYDPIARFRQTVYNHAIIRDCGIQKPRPFMAHITMAYFGRLPSHVDREQWIRPCLDAQADLLKQSLVFPISTFELRSFENMGYFQTLANGPKFCCA